MSPGSADAYAIKAPRLWHWALGRCVPLILRAQVIDPLAHRNDLASALLRAGRLEKATARAEQALQSKPEYDRGRATLGWSLFLAGEREKGVREMDGM